MHTSLSIIGAGGHGRVIADSAARTGCWDVIQFYDDATTGKIPHTDWDIVGPISHAFRGNRDSAHAAVVGIGDNRLRVKIQGKLELAGWQMGSVVDPTAAVSSASSIGAGTVVMAGAIINIGAKIGTSCIVSTNSSIDHDCQLGNGVHISPGATLAGKVTLGDLCWVGAGATLIQNISIGEKTIIGAGAIVIKDMPGNITCVGNPARTLE